MIYVDPQYIKFFSRFKRVDDFLMIDTDLVRDFKNRKTGRFELDGKGFYIKKHFECGLWAVLDELLHLRKPHIGARHEWAILNTLETIGINTMHAAAFGQEGGSLRNQRSFLITEELTHVKSLEDICRSWPQKSPAAAFKRSLLIQVADIARILHANGINHRDFYICHFLVDVGGERNFKENPQLFLIDLHRAQQRPHVPFRWRVKDIGGLYFSAMDTPLTRRDIIRFMRRYTGKPLRQTLQEDGRLWRSVRKRAFNLYRRHFGKNPDVLF